MVLKIDELWDKVNNQYKIKIAKVLEESYDISVLKQRKQLLIESDQYDLQLYLHHLKNCSDE